MKATHVVIARVGRWLQAGEKVYITGGGGPSHMVQSVKPSYGDGHWCVSAHNLKKIVTQMENK